MAKKKDTLLDEAEKIKAELDELKKKKNLGAPRGSRFDPPA